MADGTTEPISKVEPGDLVLATDPETGAQTAETVTATWVHEDTVIDLEILIPAEEAGQEGLQTATVAAAFATASTTATTRPGTVPTSSGNPPHTSTQATDSQPQAPGGNRPRSARLYSPKGRRLQPHRHHHHSYYVRGSRCGHGCWCTTRVRGSSM